jgi:hypothetical protein
MHDPHHKPRRAKSSPSSEERWSDSSFARAAQDRLAKLRARYSGDMQDVLRQAKSIRRNLMHEARNSYRNRPV